MTSRNSTIEPGQPWTRSSGSASGVRRSARGRSGSTGRRCGCGSARAALSRASCARQSYSSRQYVDQLAHVVDRRAVLPARAVDLRRGSGSARAAAGGRRGPRRRRGCGTARRRRSRHRDRVGGAEPARPRGPRPPARPGRRAAARRRSPSSVSSNTLGQIVTHWPKPPQQSASTSTLTGRVVRSEAVELARVLAEIFCRVAARTWPSSPRRSRAGSDRGTSGAGSRSRTGCCLRRPPR